MIANSQVKRYTLCERERQSSRDRVGAVTSVSIGDDARAFLPTDVHSQFIDTRTGSVRDLKVSHKLPLNEAMSTCANAR
jgi:hypothetical protein